ncbi:hypothetical protein E1B28_010243 [Marasmius oreades]|uniref:Uncharacterized protein n=1 Tax=Marasmius oreades TaxID=181124 RepID=A0A9P7RXE4_9AGAR|nr:uncharacterized protein E1B28_010243 [Marasmius oreades]KAG7091192.1 hypothetical protein E1B28_010243 [Marasmius oreades]
MGTPRRHPRFYIETIVFQVVDTLFRVPSRYLREHSEILGAASEISAATTEGTSDETPVKLPLPDDATIEDFENFMEIVVPTALNLPCPSFSKPKWISILKLSTCWMFDELRSRAINTVPGLSFLEQVQWGRRYKVKAWLLKGLSGLANSTNALTPLEVLEDNLDVRTIARVLYIRTFLQSDSRCKQLQADIRTTKYVNYQTVHTSACEQCGKHKDTHSQRPHVEVEVEKWFGSELSLLVI